jgi:hypothetical protein
VPDDDLAVISDQHGIGKTKPLDAVRDLPDLLLGMDAGRSTRSFLDARTMGSKKSLMSSPAETFFVLGRALSI